MKREVGPWCEDEDTTQRPMTIPNRREDVQNTQRWITSSGHVFSHLESSLMDVVSPLHQETSISGGG